MANLVYDILWTDLSAFSEILDNKHLKISTVVDNIIRDH